MGRSVTPTYRVTLALLRLESRCGSRSSTAVSWSRAPSEEALTRYVRDLEDSTLPGGVNEHLGVSRVAHARVIHQASGAVVAEYDPPMFEVV